MTRDTRNNLIVATVAISLVVHVGTMIWAKPRVMTHVAAGIARLTKHGPMHVTKASVRPEPVAINVLKDEEAKKDAPKTDETVAILPSDETALPAAPTQTPIPEATMPEVLSRLTPETTAPKIERTSIPQMQEVATVPKMTFESPKMAQTDASAPTLTMPSDVAIAPVFEAPVFAPVGTFKESIAKLDKTEDSAKEVFKAVEEVMPEVDEEIVQAEKEAVRSLINSDNALDMRTAADVTMTTCTSGSYTYFKVTACPKPRLPNVPKDVVILIDASGSIGHDRLASCRKAAKEILRTAMNTGDRFNLVAFRDKFSYCFKTWQTCTTASYAAGDQWMMRLAAHGRTDVFSTISSVLTLPREPTRPLIALVVTDGDANAGVSETADILSRFTTLNDGLISVYMYGVKSSANRELIDVLTHGNRGESFIFEGWRWNAGEGIGSFSERFRDPLITDLRVVFPAAYAIESYPLLLKNLYRNNTVTWFGRTKGTPKEIAFSLRGIAGGLAYDGFFRLPVKGARTDATLPEAWRNERAINEKLR